MTSPPPTGDASVANASVMDRTIAARRASARRTALVFAGVAVAVYVAFMLLNVVAK